MALGTIGMGVEAMVTTGEVLRIVVDVLHSAWWRNAEVIVLDCGHRHVRPRGYSPPKGESLPCCFCEDERADHESDGL